MNEHELRDALREAGDEDVDARERSWRIVQRAYTDYEPRGPRRPRVALAVAAILIAATAALGGAAASAPDGDVAHLVRGVLGLGEREARPALGRLPGPPPLRWTRGR